MIWSRFNAGIIDGKKHKKCMKFPSENIRVKEFVINYPNFQFIYFAGNYLNLTRAVSYLCSFE